MNTTIRNIAFSLVILVCGVLLLKMVQGSVGGGVKEQEIAFSQFMRNVDDNQVSDVTLNGSNVHGKYKSGATGFHTVVPVNYPRMIDELRDKGVNIIVKDSSGNAWPNYLLNLSPLILFAALWFMMIREIQIRRK